MKEETYSDVVNFTCEPEVVWCSWEAAVLLLYYAGKLTPELAYPCGPGFSAQ